MILFFFAFISVPVRLLAASSPLKGSQTMWFSLHATTLSCTILSTPWPGGLSLSALMWTTASHRSPWTEWALPMDSTMLCLSEQVKVWFLIPTLFCQHDDGKGSWWILTVIPDKGTVLKVINVPKGSWNNMEELLLEELEVFKVRRLWKYQVLVCVIFSWTVGKSCFILKKN